MDRQQKPLKSPCVSVCVLNRDDICIGCYRSGGEISDWGAMDNQRRREVLQRAAAREKRVNPFASQQ